VQRKHYFSPNRFYCVETICAPCGVVIAWTKFDKAESPTNILKFLQDIFPNEKSHPAYICIDKACQVVRTAVNNGSWNIWKTSRFIVDSYHYTNHRASDELCRKYCNPAPTDGSAPNLVGQRVDNNGVVHDVREFNTQICEQLNAWIGGFESILKRMTSKNFNWFLHVMLFYHVKHVLIKSSVSPVADNQDDDHSNISEEEKNSDSDSDSEDEESGSSSDQESRKSSEEESTSSSSGKDNVDLNSDGKSDDDDTEDSTTDSDDEVPIGDINDEMVEENEEDEEDEDEDEESDEHEMEVDDD